MTAVSTAVEVRTRPIDERSGDLGSWIAGRLERWARTRPDAETLILSLPAPRVEPEALLEVAPAGLDFFWHPAGRAAVAGAGAAHCLRLRGGDRFGELRQRAERIFRGLDTVSHPECTSAPPPRFYGGLAFDVGAADSEPWQSFGDGCFTLPRFLYARDGEQATLSVALRREEAADGESRTAEALAVLDALARWHRTPSIAPAVLEIERPPRHRFAGQVESIRAAIASGAFAKIVAASCSRARLASPLDTSAVLRRLREGLLHSARSRDTRFAFCRRDAAFLGATPERLVARRGAIVETEALAGSIASGGDRGELLLASAKDLGEHQLVVDSIVRRLRPLTDRLEVASRPRILELRDVLHLRTPISGLLQAPRHVLELVAELHPTPAVGGVPTPAAMRWIREHEAEDRGWYAAPVGWFDAAGDGEFAVALRSCVLRGDEAFIYAGAGIVRDSDPELEYTETELKKQTLLTALGA